MRRPARSDFIQVHPCTLVGSTATDLLLGEVTRSSEDDDEGRVLESDGITAAGRGDVASSLRVLRGGHGCCSRVRVSERLMPCACKRWARRSGKEGGARDASPARSPRPGSSRALTNSVMVLVQYIATSDSSSITPCFNISLQRVFQLGRPAPAHRAGDSHAGGSSVANRVSPAADRRKERLI